MILSFSSLVGKYHQIRLQEENKKVGKVKMRETTGEPQGQEQSPNCLLKNTRLQTWWGGGGERTEITVPFSFKKKNGGSN